MTVDGKEYGKVFNTFIRWNAEGVYGTDQLYSLVSFDISGWGLEASDKTIDWWITFDSSNSGFGFEPGSTNPPAANDHLNIAVFNGQNGAWFESLVPSAGWDWEDRDGYLVEYQDPFNYSFGVRFLTTVPEPASLSILALGVGGLLLRRRKH